MMSSPFRLASKIKIYENGKRNLEKTSRGLSLGAQMTRGYPRALLAGTMIFSALYTKLPVASRKTGSRQCLFGQQHKSPACQDASYIFLSL
jgi:hypothetical protein